MQRAVSHVTPTTLKQAFSRGKLEKANVYAIFRTVQVDALRKGLRMIRLFSDHCRISCTKSSLRILAEDSLHTIKICWTVYGDEDDAGLGGGVENYECVSPVCVSIEFDALCQMLASHITAIDLTISKSTRDDAPFAVQCQLHSQGGPHQKCTLTLPVLNDETEDLKRLEGLQSLKYITSFWVSSYSLQYSLRFISICGVKWIRLSSDTGATHVGICAVLGDEEDYSKFCTSPVLSRAAVRVRCKHQDSGGKLMGLATCEPQVSTVFVSATTLHKLGKNLVDICNTEVGELGACIMLSTEPGKPIKLSTMIGVIGTMHVWLAEAPEELYEY